MRPRPRYTAAGALLRASGALDRTLRFAQAYANTVGDRCAALPSSRGTRWIATLTRQTLARCSRWRAAAEPGPDRLTGDSLDR